MRKEVLKILLKVFEREGIQVVEVKEKYPGRFLYGRTTNAVVVKEHPNTLFKRLEGKKGRDIEKLVNWWKCCGRWDNLAFQYIIY